VSTATEETTSGNQNLADLAERVAGWASSGEEVEVYVARGTETEVRAYDGEVESLTSATSAGIGIRVIVDHRLGFAWAGSLDESVLGETVRYGRRARSTSRARRRGRRAGGPVG
jgi:predicted Zn-dependent protease